MKFHLLIAAGAFLCASFAVSAAECEYPFDKTVGEFSAAGAPPTIIDEGDLPAIVDGLEAATGTEIGTVTRGFIVSVGGKVLLGLEVDGCLLPPVVVGSAVVAPEPKLSGKDASGKIGA